MADVEKSLASLKSLRDEIKLKIHLGSMDLQQEWTGLEERWHQFESKAQLNRSAGDVGAALEILGSELKNAYERVKNTLAK